MGYYFQRTKEAPMDFEYDQPRLFAFNMISNESIDPNLKSNTFLSTTNTTPFNKQKKIDESQTPFMKDNKNNTKGLFGSKSIFHIPPSINKLHSKIEEMDLDIIKESNSPPFEQPKLDSKNKKMENNEIIYSNALVPYQSNIKDETSTSSSSKLPMFSNLFNCWKKSNNAKENIDKNEMNYDNNNNNNNNINEDDVYNNMNLHMDNSIDNNNNNNNENENENDIFNHINNNLNSPYNNHINQPSSFYSHLYPMSATYYHHDPVAHKKSLINYSAGLIRVGFQLALFSILLYIGLQFVITLKADVNSKLLIYESESLERYFICNQEYDRNRCHPSTRLPAMEEECRQWQQCLYTPAWIGKTKVLAETFAEIINGFIDTISLKAILVLGVIIILLSFSLKKHTPLPITSSS